MVLRGLNTIWEAQGRWHAMFGQGRDDREATNAGGGAKGMTGRGMRRRGLGHSSAAADCPVPHSVGQHSPPRCPPRSTANSGFMRPKTEPKKPAKKKAAPKISHAATLMRAPA